MVDKKRDKIDPALGSINVLSNGLRSLQESMRAAQPVINPSFFGCNILRDLHDAMQTTLPVASMQNMMNGILQPMRELMNAVHPPVAASFFLKNPIKDLHEAMRIISPGASMASSLNAMAISIRESMRLDFSTIGASTFAENSIYAFREAINLNSSAAISSHDIDHPESIRSLVNVFSATIPRDNLEDIENGNVNEAVEYISKSFADGAKLLGEDDNYFCLLSKLRDILDDVQHSPLCKKVISLVQQFAITLFCTIIASYVIESGSPLSKEDDRRVVKGLKNSMSGEYGAANLRIVTVKSNLNVRNRPNTKSLVVGSLPPYCIVSLEKNKNKWGFIRYKGHDGRELSGWVYKKHLTKGGVGVAR